MSSQTETDLHAQEISAGLTKLHELLEKPVARNALDLSKNATTASQHEILRRLRQGLRQYLERDGNLFYVGLLGHFSAGKSSTINSLLNAWSSNHERQTGLNPTDTTITLITQEKNSSSLVGVIREGHVTIRLQTVESPILDQIVLVDTPGTGDPQFIEEVARDFLPICDVILFLLSAASPFDKSDVPLLLELHKRLPFIPLHFVVTRADELRIDHSSPMTEENMNRTKRDEFLSEVATRVNTLLAPEVYLAKHFILIDNKSGFNIEKLAAFLKAKGDGSSPQSHVAMHMNKLHFFLSSARGLRDYFASVLDKKLVELDKIVQAAERNIQKYQEIVQISNSNLTKAWIDHVTSVNAAKTGAVDRMRVISALPESYKRFPKVIGKRSETSRDLSRDARFSATSVSAGLKAQMTSSLRDHFYQVQKAIGETPLLSLTASIHGVKSIHFNSDFGNIDFMSPTLLSRRSTDLATTEAESLREIASDLRRGAKDFEELLQQRSPLAECEAIIETARESLKSDLDKFFQNVELYRSGVFSHTTKESIATLGIGQHLDELEAEFKEDDKDFFASEALNQLFPGFSELSTRAISKLGALASRLRPLSEEIRGLRVDSPEDNFKLIENSTATARVTIEAELSQQLQSEVDRFCGNVGIKVANILVNTKALLDAEIRRVRSARWRRYLLVAAVTAVVLIGGHLAYYHYKQPAPSTTVGSILASIVGSILVEGLALFFAKLKENVPEQVTKARQRFEAKLADEIRQATDETLRSHEFESLNEIAISNRLTQSYEQILASTCATWQETATETFRALAKIHAEYLALRMEYTALIDEVAQECSHYFADTERNLGILNTVAGKIKEQAIEPSFGLLEQTREELEFVKQEVAAVQFA